MRKFAIKKTADAEAEGVSSKPAKSGKDWLKEHWRLVTLFAIIAMAFVLRFVFAYGISAGSDFSLSGGTSASNHLRIIVEILAGTYDPANQTALNYPYGAPSTYGPFFDFVMAGFAGFVGLFGLSDQTAAAAVLAWSAPIFGALTCIPVYLIGRRMFRDEIVGIIAALFYAIFALTIMTTPFSNGTEYPMVCFLVALLVAMVVRTIDNVDSMNTKGIWTFLKVKKLRADAVIVGVLIALIALSWSDFRVIILVAAVIMTLAIVIERITGKDFSAPVGIFNLSLIIGIGISAIYYIPTGLWDEVFSGGCVLAILTVVLSTAAVYTAKKPWVLTIPVFAIVIAAIAVVLYFAVPDLYDAVINGNAYYDNELMASLANSFSRSSISAMASWYGWVTVWFPLILGAWMFFRYRKDGGSHLYIFSTLWLLSMFCIGWFTSNYAVVSASAFAVATAAVLIRVLRAVKMKDYLRSLKTLRGQGGKVAAKKVFNFFPFVTLVCVIALIAAPAAVYAIDAATPTNDEKSDYFGGLGYTINTTDSNMVTKVWDSYSDVPKSGALITWYGYADSAASLGGFDVVTSSNGGGTYTMANAYLAESGSGALIAMTLRLMDGLNADQLSTLLAKDGIILADDQAKIKAALSDSDPNKGYAAAYDVLSYYSYPDLCTLYNYTCSVSDARIGYIEVDTSMLPLYYNDGSAFSTIAYFGGHDLDAYGAATDYFSYNTYTGYATYTEAMYNTFLYNALIGMTPGAAGQNSVLSYYQALSADDGTVPIAPGNGLDGFAIDSWYVTYNADSKADSDSSGWKKMPYEEAIAAQKANGGVINYMSSVIVYKFVGGGSSSVLSGTVTSNAANAAGVAVYVYAPASYDNAKYTVFSTGCTDNAGHYEVFVPTTDYYVSFATAQGSTVGSGTVEKTVKKTEIAGTTCDVNLGVTSIEGSVVSGDGVLDFNGTIVLSSALDTRYAVADVIIPVAAGVFAETTLSPGSYTATLYKTDGSVVSASTLTIPAGDHDNVQISANVGTVSVNVDDQFGASVEDGTAVTLIDVSDQSISYPGATDDGVATIQVPAGSYIVTLTGAYTSASTPVVDVTAGQSASATIVAYEAVHIAVTGPANDTVVSLYSGSLQLSSKVVAGQADFEVPSLLKSTYYAYAVSGTTVYTGSVTVTDADDAIVNLALASAEGVTVSGTVTFDKKEVAGATVVLIGASGQMIFSTDKDGKYSALVPAGAYNVYAYNGSNVSITSVDAAAGAVHDITLAEGMSVSQGVNYSYNSSSSKPIAFTDVRLNVTCSVAGFTFMGMTDGTGKATFIVPSGDDAAGSAFVAAPTVGYFLNAENTDKTAEYGKDKTLTDVTFKAANVTTPTALIDGNALTGTVNLKDNSASVAPGSYTLIVDDPLGHYYGSVNIYPSTTFYDIELYAFKLNLTVPADTTVSVTKDENADGETGGYYTDTKASTSTLKVYYLENDFGYTFKVTDSAGNIGYYSVDVAAPGTLDADVGELKAKATITGNVGVNADGKLRVTMGTVRLFASVSGGEYSVDVPVLTDLTFDLSGVTNADGKSNYTYNANKAIPALAVGTTEVVCNFSSAATVATYSASEAVVLNDANLDYSTYSGTMQIEIFNNGDLPATYIVSGSSDLALDKAYVVTVGAGLSQVVNMNVTRFSGSIGAGATSMGVTVKTLDGTAVGYAYVPAAFFSNGAVDGAKVTVSVAGAEGASADAVNEYSYKYAFTFVNNNVAPTQATFTIGDTAGWARYIVSEDGYLISEFAGATATVDISGMSTETVYVMLVNTGSTEGTAPELAYNVAFAGNSSDGTLQVKAGSVAKDSGSASGDGIDNSAKTLSTTFWVLTILVLLTVFIFFWASMKRGVFGRKH